VAQALLESRQRVELLQEATDHHDSSREKLAPPSPSSAEPHMAAEYDEASSPIDPPLSEDEATEPKTPPRAPTPLPAKVPRHRRVATALRGIREPRTPTDLADLIDELEQLEALVDEDRLDAVRALDPQDQRAWLKLTAAWSRHVGLLSDVQRPQRERLRAVFGTAAEFSKVERPGFVHGLAADHEPEGKSWLEDAERAYWALEEAREEPAA